MSKKATSLKCDAAFKKNGDRAELLHRAQKTALDDTATALQSIIHQQKLTIQLEDSAVGNVTDAKKDIIDAMVNLAIASSEGSYTKTKEILAGYGLDDIV